MYPQVYEYNQPSTFTIYSGTEHKKMLSCRPASFIQHYMLIFLKTIRLLKYNSSHSKYVGISDSFSISTTLLLS